MYKRVCVCVCVWCSDCANAKTRPCCHKCPGYKPFQTINCTLSWLIVEIEHSSVTGSQVSRRLFNFKMLLYNIWTTKCWGKAGGPIWQPSGMHNFTHYHNSTPLCSWIGYELKGLSVDPCPEGGLCYCAPRNLNQETLTLTLHPLCHDCDSELTSQTNPYLGAITLQHNLYPKEVSEVSMRPFILVYTQIYCLRPPFQRRQ